MKQFVQSLLAGWIAFQALACAGAAQSVEDNDDNAPSAVDVAPDDGLVAAQQRESDADEAPQGIELLSPAERDTELDELTGPRGVNLEDLVLQARLLEAGLHNVQVIDPPREAGGE